MYICNTKKDNVKKAIGILLTYSTGDFELYKRGWDRCGVSAVLQVNMKDYKHLKTITSVREMIDQAKQREAKHVINLNTLTIHKKDCCYKGKRIIKASLINIKNTGLNICNHCK